MTQIDTIAAHRDALVDQERLLSPSFRDAPIGTDDAMPWQVDVDGRQNMADEARRAGVDVAVGADKPGGDCAHPSDNARDASLGVRRQWSPGHRFNR